MTAGLKTLEILARPGQYEYLDKITKRLVEGILQAGRDAGHAVEGGSISGAPHTAPVQPLRLQSTLGCALHKAVLDFSHMYVTQTRQGSASSLSVHMCVCAAMFGFFFAEGGPITKFEDAVERADAKKFALWHRGMLEHGVYLAPSMYEVTV